MKRTQKQQLAYLKENEYRFAVYTFSKEGLRKEAYIGLDAIEALEYISKCLAQNLQVVLTFREDHTYILEEERFIDSKRCDYDFYKKYEVCCIDNKWVRRMSSEYPF